MTDLDRIEIQRVTFTLGVLAGAAVAAVLIIRRVTH